MKILKKLLKKEKPFRCGGESSIVFEDRGKYARIWYRQPTGDEVLDFCHASIMDDEIILKEIQSDASARKMHQITRMQNLIPFAKKIITRWEGYANEKGKEIKSIEDIEKWFPHHIEIVAIRGYEQLETCKKKD